MTNLLLTCGAIGPLLFITVFTVEGALRPGYRPWRHFISLLARGDRSWVQTANFIVCGLFMLAFAVGAARTVISDTMPLMLALFGFALIYSGLYRADPALGYPPGTPPWPQHPSRNGNFHNLAGAVAFITVPIAAFAFASHVRGGWRMYSIATGVLMPVFFVVSGALAEKASRAPLQDPPVGLVQRAAVIIGWTWIAAVALHLRS
jgi:hypothetical protein